MNFHIPRIINADDVICAREEFDLKGPEMPLVYGLLKEHAAELRGIPIDPDIEAFIKGQQAGRVVIISARLDGTIIGYCVHILVREAHFKHLVALDDLTYVAPAFRRQGIGTRLREKAQEELKKEKVRHVFARFKVGHDHPTSMAAMGYRPFEIVYIKEL